MSEIRKEPSHTLIKPEQDVVGSVVNDFKDEILSLINGGESELVLDLSEVEMIDSSGLGLLIAAHNALSRAGGRLRVTNVSKSIYNLMKIMRLDQHFEISSTM